jgi:hypothetical protein
VPEILLQPAPTTAVAQPARPKRTRRKTKRETNAAGEGPPAGGT